MLKNITNLGSILKATEQKSINGGLSSICPSEGKRCNSMFPSPVHCITIHAYCCVEGFFQKC
ncbi:hypothetical protein [uncultured Tenacibaculum sp.]|uniref:hypothetical protein n=1 Tax=uncultured Tenacibaculum sp. TaxID=174713 RepID=UPI00263717A6|nr:hypothetical protein [uncultured Tenacibaculum sp.]